MSFYYKVFVSIFGVALLSIFLISFLLIQVQSREAKVIFEGRHLNFVKRVSKALQVIEVENDRIARNALKFLSYFEEKEGLPSNSQLMQLSHQLGVEDIYITNKKGRFVRSDLFEEFALYPERYSKIVDYKPLEKSLFSYCAGYKELIDGDALLEQTPILPTGYITRALKFSMIPNHNRSRVIEVAMNMDFIEHTLSEMVGADTDILELGLYTPAGQMLGSFPSEIDVTTMLKDKMALDGMTFDSPIWSDDRLFVITKIPVSNTNCCECRAKGVSSEAGEYFYVLRAEISTVPFSAAVNKLRNSIVGLTLLAFILSILASRLISRKLFERLESLSKGAQRVRDQGDLNFKIEQSGSDEISEIISSFNQMISELNITQNRLIDSTKYEAVGKVATQIFHDIRSPLAALEAATIDLSGIPEARRNVMAKAIDRISVINQGLVRKQKEAAALRQGASVVSVVSVLADIAAEKRVQYREHGAELVFRGDHSPYGLFLNVPIYEFHRVLSNLIDNAYEAILGVGEVRLGLEGLGGALRISVCDNGRGIASDKIDEVLVEGVTLGKLNGSGLGLSYAKEMVEAWGGELKVESKIGEGTTIGVLLPTAREPEWFISHIDLSELEEIVIIDDDPSIHQVWNLRLSEASRRQFRLLHYYNAEDFLEWVNGGAIQCKRLILMDYIFSGSEKNGLMVLDEAKMALGAVLVTARWDDFEVQERCVYLGVRLLPKEEAAFLPLECSSCK